MWPLRLGLAECVAPKVSYGPSSPFIPLSLPHQGCAWQARPGARITRARCVAGIGSRAADGKARAGARNTEVGRGAGVAIITVRSVSLRQQQGGAVCKARRNLEPGDPSQTPLVGFEPGGSKPAAGSRLIEIHEACKMCYKL